MVIQVLDAVIIIYRPFAIFALDQFINSTQAVFDDEQWFLVAIPESVQDDAQAFRIDLPSPLGSFQIRIHHSTEDIACPLHLLGLVSCFSRTHIVAEGNEIDRVFQDFFIFRCDVQLDTVLTEITLHVTRVRSAYMHIREEEVLAIRFHHGDDIIRMGSQWVCRHCNDHAADFEIRIDFVADFCRQSAGYQFVVTSLVQI
ncbi:hypothetical protein SDC9_157102 [bioreactor metagenome]|uniref:Uncharacterized protein n=1 Tax=bioreactor metagenome TaxID=1076179 RepID=A0A645F7E5_9ZZZZ